MNQINLETKSISQIASLVRQDWKKVYFGAVPYLDAMSCLESISDNYGCDRGSEIVNYFLANATTWRGDVAREIKKELNKRVKNS
jgi:hypothetical protein